MFKPVESKWDPPALEEQVLQWWRENRTFEKLLAQNADGPRWSFIDGPITANNPMGVHHAWGRMYKDLYQRYKAMQGYRLRYQNGFDCQGLWVEVEVEKALGFNSKRDIEAFGLDNFARACKERVLKYADLISRQSERLGMWMRWDDSYYTYTDTNILYIWYFLKQCRANGWLYQGTRSMPWCVRCGTSLSQHEMLDSYKEMTHRSVYLRQPLTAPGPEGQPRPTGEWLLLWTTTPWTLSANVAAAVQPDLDYAKVRQGEHVYYLSKGTLGRLAGPYELLGTVRGRELVGRTYAGPFDEVPAQAGVTHRVIPWEDVGEEEGTGIVHIAPGCGAEDFELSRTNDLPVLVPINETGDYVPGYGALVGHNAMNVADTVFASLEEKGYLYRVEDYTHRYPVCWRCSTDLVFRVVTEWFISADEIRPRMKAAAARVTWYPEEAGKRMQDWLNNMRDWCISRKRFWGLPLPFYVCAECGEVNQAGSREELRAMAVNPEVVDALPELHRPWIDEVKVRCQKCGTTTERIPEVGDCWLDAGIVAFSTLGYLGDGPGRGYWEEWFPADWVSESREQIRLWFYAMLFASVTLEDTAPYQSVLVYEKVHDEHDRPMHKSHGNAIEFSAAASRMGADVMRWIFAAQNPKVNLRFGFGAAEETVRRLLTLWNTYSFFVTYARLDGFDPKTTPAVPVRERTELDCWVLSRLHELVRDTHRHLDEYDSASVTRDVEGFVDDLSNWYVRRSRRRFWKSGDDADKRAAYWTLYEVLTTLVRLLAPIMPFLMESMYQNLVAAVDPAQPSSVHLAAYPVANSDLIDEALMADVALVEQVVELGRAARARSKMRVRQPLREMLVHVRNDDEAEALRTHADQVLDELNIKHLTLVEDPAELVSYVIKPNLPVLGPRFGKRLGAVRSALGALDPAEVATTVGAGHVLRLNVNGDEEEVVLAPDDVIVETQQKAGFVVEQDRGLVVALDTTLTEDLRQEAVARDLVRLYNELRKAAGFAISDRITATYALAPGGPDLPANGERLHAALDRFRSYVQDETLSLALANADPPPGAFARTEQLDGLDVVLSVRRAG